MLQRTEDETLDVTLGDHDATRRLVIVLQKVLYKIRSDATVQLPNSLAEVSKQLYCSLTAAFRPAS